MANPQAPFSNVSFGAPTGQPRPTLPSHQMPIPAASPLPGSPSATQAAGNSVIEQLLAKLKQEENPATTGMANVSSVLGGAANNEQANRLIKGQFSQGYDDNMIAAQTGRNQNEGDALKKLAITSYLKSGGFKGGPMSVQMDGQMRSLPTYGSAPRPASAAQMQGASTLEDMLKQRLASGGSYLPQALSGYATPGKLEKGLGYGGEVIGGLGAVNSGVNPKGTTGNVMSQMLNAGMKLYQDHTNKGQ